jgi:general secretion pathway protein A
MYEDYYGFTEKPFNLTPDPKYLFKSSSHANAFELLQYAVRRREGFVVITGDIGTGKTTLCRAVLDQLDRKTFSAMILNPFLSEEDLLRLILQDFGVVSRDEMKRGRLAGVSKQELIDTLNAFLLSLQPLGASALLIIDEAQNLPLQVIEQIRILSNLETDKEKLLQIVLVGQPNLKGMLRTMELRQLEQRVSIKYELRPLSHEETGAYVMHRLSIAGGAAVSFSPQALTRIHRITGGIPRVINLVCDRALLAAFSAHSNRVTPAHVVHAAETLDLADARTSFKKWLKQRAAPFAAGLGFAALVSVGAAYAWQPRTPTPPVAQNSTVAPTEKPVSTPAVAAIDPNAPAAAVSRPADAQVPTPIATTGSPSKSYSVLVASFRMASEADMLATELREMGYQAAIGRTQGSTNGWWHQVTAGPFGDLDAARETESRLRQLPGYADAHLIRN